MKRKPSPARQRTRPHARSKGATSTIRRKEALPKTYEELERQIQERTAEFRIAIEKLKQEITERKRAEEALEHSRALLKSFVEHTPAAVAMLDRDLKYVAVSKRWVRDYRLGDETIIGCHHYDVFPEIRERKDWQEVHQRCLAGAVERRDEDCFVRQDGTEDWLCWEVQPWHGEGNEIGGIILFTEVITQRKLAEGELHSALDRLRAVIGNSPIAIVSLDVQGRVTGWNQAAGHVFGWTEEEVLGREPPYLAPGQEQESEIIWERVMRGEQLGGLELRRLKKDGSPVDIAVWATRLFDQHGTVTGSMGLEIDITERKRAEEALRESERQLCQLIEDRERISRDLHDNIIQTLYAVGMSLEECTRLIEEDSTQAIAHTGRAIAELNSAIRDVRKYITGSEPRILSETQLSAELARLVRTMESPHLLRFQLNVDPLAATQLPPEKAQHVLHIACEAMSNSLRHSGGRSGAISLQMLDGCVRLEVQDDGVGFDHAAVTDERRHGLRNIAARADAIGAAFEVISTPGCGTRIVLDIPKDAPDVVA